jgi:hypothetical protein
MNNHELERFAAKRHGPLWIAPLAAETGYSFSGLWRIVNRDGPIPRRLEREIQRLRKPAAANGTKKN